MNEPNLKFEINMEDLTEAQKADIEAQNNMEDLTADISLFQKHFQGCKIFSYSTKPKIRFSILEGMGIIAIANYNNPKKDYLEEENEGYIPEISKEQLERIKPFIKNITSIRKAKNKPFVAELKSGLFLWIAPKLCQKAD